MPATTTLPDGMIHCSICGGDFERLGVSTLEGCSVCAAYKGSFGPGHYSSDMCESGGVRRHAGCKARNSHCTCDRCF